MLPAPTRDQSFRIEPGREPTDVFADLASSFQPCVHEGPRRRTVFYDTFDRRLRKRGWTLSTTREGSGVRLRWEEAGEVHEELGAGPLDFAASLPAGPIRDALGPVLEMRRLLPTVEIEREDALVDMLDQRSKTVARVLLVGGRARDPLERDQWHDLPPLLWVTALRGYEREFDTLCDTLRGQPGVRDTESDILGWALRAAYGVEVPDPSTWRPDLHPELRAETGVKRVYSVLLRQMLANEPGVRANLDSEFLHDFRVAARRTRSFLAQLKRVLPAPAVAHFGAEFAWLGQLTGPTRDLDVFLLDVADWPKGLDEGELERISEVLRAEQRTAHRALVSGLDSPRFASLVSDWRAFLDAPPPVRPLAKNAHRPLREVVGREIRRRYRLIRRRGGVIDDDSPPERLHELRIDCKKMRYLIDCAREIFAPEVDRVVRRLKGLQNVLGTYNDCDVQRQRLEGFARRLASRGAAEPATLLTLGRMIEQIERRAARARRRFAERFEVFASKKTRKLCSSVFGSHGDPVDSKDALAR